MLGEPTTARKAMLFTTGHSLEHAKQHTYNSCLLAWSESCFVLAAALIIIHLSASEAILSALPL